MKTDSVKPLSATLFNNIPLKPYKSSKEFIRDIISFCTNGEKGMICYLNADIYNRMQKDADFKSIMRSAKIVYADGISIVLAARFFLKKRFPRLTAADYLHDFLQEADKQALKIFFLGSTSPVLNTLNNHIKSTFPRLSTAFHHGYFSDKESAQVLEQISAFKPHLIISAMGSPRQEKWSRNALAHLDCMIWNVGALLDFYTGEASRAPLFMQKAGLEWLYRLLCEPRRLAKRYCIGNITFIVNVIRNRKNVHKTDE